MKYELKVYKLSANEKTKSLKIANKIIEQLLKNNFNRSDCIIALGGGVLGDLSAFISNLTKRGLKFVNIPTTLLAQVDASIGGKTGINFFIYVFFIFFHKINNFIKFFLFKNFTNIHW